MRYIKKRLKIMNSYLKWVGGKSSLFDELYLYFPKKINKYIEPFVGSASVVLSLIDDIKNKKILIDNVLYENNISFPDPKKFIVNDYNYYLIKCHLSVKYNVLKLIEELDKLQNEFNNSDNKLLFYKDKRNNLNSFMKKDFKKDDDIIKYSSLFIFINKTCFNGVWRVNSKNENNVPWNKVEDVNIYNKKNILLISDLFKYVDFRCEDFYDFVCDTLEKDDFVFLDPPYIPISKTSNFTKYNKVEWSKDDNKRLKKLLYLINDRKANFMMTNSYSDEVLKLFGDFKITYIYAHRFVKPEKKKFKRSSEKIRKRVKETIITNY